MLTFFSRLLFEYFSLSPLFSIILVISIDWISDSYLPVSLLLAVISVVLCWGFIKYIFCKIEATKLTMKTFESVDRENIAVFLTYFIPLFTMSAGGPNWKVGIIIFVSVVILGARSHVSCFNPFLLILGWHYYKVVTCDGATHIVLSKESFINTDDKLSVIFLTHNVCIFKEYYKEKNSK